MKNVLGRIAKDIKDYFWVGIVIAVYYGLMHFVFHAFCPLVLITGMPCPGCGMTRAVLFVCTGQFTRAFNMNPIAFLVVLFVLYCAGVRYLSGKKVMGFKTGLVVLCIILIAAYVYRMYLFFPDRTPYVYTRGSYLERLIPGYLETVREILRQIRENRL